MSDSLKEKQLFRGFIGGDSFQTKKGFKGNKLDTLWAKYLFKSLDLDDEELAVIALQSSIADLDSKVIGGELGTPYSIGGYGFYAKNQFEMQSTLLKDGERINSKGRNFLSIAEWGKVDEQLDKLGHHGAHTFLRAIRGDSFACLAVKKSAFSVAKYLLDIGIDPLHDNEEGHDLLHIVKEQYSDLSKELLQLQRDYEVVSVKVMVPTQLKELSNRNDELEGFFLPIYTLYNRFVILIINQFYRSFSGIN